MRRDGEEAFQVAATPVLDALRDAGLPTDGFGVFRTARGAKVIGEAPPFDYERSVSILVEWLSVVEDRRVRGAIVRSLSTRHAKPAATSALLTEFRRASDDPLGLQWAVGNALEVIADRSMFDDLVVLARERSYGRGREMVVLAIAKTKHPDAAKVLIELLDDDDVAGHAVAGLRKLAPAEARSALEPFTADQRAWVRREAVAALSKIDSKQSSG